MKMAGFLAAPVSVLMKNRIGIEFSNDGHQVFGGTGVANDLPQLANLHFHLFKITGRAHFLKFRRGYFKQFVFYRDPASPRFDSVR